MMLNVRLNSIRHVPFISHTIIHTDTQVGPCLDEAQSPSFTLTFLPTWGQTHIHTTKVM